MSDIRIIATAGDQIISDEVSAAVRQVLGEKSNIRACKMSELPSADTADLFICVSSRKQEVEKKIPSEKVLGIELVPANAFFVELAKIPAGETIHIFNNSTAYANQLVRYCNEIGIDHLQFAYIPYDELSESEVVSRLQQAKYIMGVETIVGSKGVFTQKFKQYAPPITRVFAAKRVPSVTSACDMMKWITAHSHNQLMNKVMNLTNHLTQQMHEIMTIAQRMSDAVEKETAAFTRLDSKMGQGMSRLEHVNQLAGELSGSAKGIGQVADAIKHISGQTNLLALNASIEAARVGDAGRGFAVVAREVGKLAAESQQSTETIRKAISSIQASVAQIAPAVSTMSSEMAENQHFFSEILRNSQEENQSIIRIFKALENIQSTSEQLLKITSSL